MHRTRKNHQARSASTSRTVHRRSREYLVQAIEARVLLSAAAANALKTEFIDWNGQQNVEVAAGQWIVHLKDIKGDVQSQIAKAKQYAGGLSHKFTVGQQLGSNGMFVFHALETLTPQVQAQTLRHLPGIALVEPDFVRHADVVANDPQFTSQWGLSDTTSFGIKTTTAWGITTGSSSTVVADIDTGADYNHQDLAANIWTNPGEIAGNSIDDDHNGFIDDVHGYDFANGDGDPMDDNGHGTHTAGTIAAATNNSLGVAGVNWHAKIMVLKFLGANGSGSDSAAIQCINYAIQMKNRGVNVRVSNNSWGGAGFDGALQSAIQSAANAGQLFVAAAGNDGMNIDVGGQASYPAGYTNDNIISVANITSSGGLNGTSNFGTTSVDLGAPGTGVISTTPNNTYSNFTGTSMAAPHVTGVVSLILGLSPSASYQSIKSAILNNTDATVSLSGKTLTGGRLNAFKALTPFAKLPVLTAASDSGVSNSDNITNDNTPMFTGTAAAGAAVQLFANGVQVGSATADGSGNYAITTSQLADGNYDITANWTGAAAPTAAVGITIDTVGLPPSQPDLDTANDSGLSNSDNITKNTTLKFTSTGEVGTISFFFDGALQSTGPSDGFTDSITVGPLSDGVHTVSASITDLAGNASAPSATLSVTVDTVANAPSVPALATASDTGVAGDGITKLLQPSFTGTTTNESGGTVRLFVDGAIAAVGNIAGTSYSLVPGAGLTNGTHQVSANLTDLAGNTSSTTSTSQVTVDTTPPTVVEGSGFNYLLTPQSIALTFSEEVGFSVQRNDLFLTNNDTGENVPVTAMAVSYSGTTATWTFPGLPSQVMPDGNYTATVFASRITDVAGNALPEDFSSDFFVLSADANHDRVVDTLDFNALAANFGGTGKNYSQGDFNYDTVVDTLDFNSLAGNFGHSLAAVPAMLQAQSLAAPAAPTNGATGLFSAVGINQNDRTILDPAPVDSALPA